MNPANDSLTILNTSQLSGSSTLLASNVSTTVVPFATGSEPVGVALGPVSTNTAWVVLRKGQALVPVTGINTSSPTVGTPIPVGSEPTGVALSPHGRFAVVANFGETTVSIVDLGSMSVTHTLDTSEIPLCGTVAGSGADAGCVFNPGNPHAVTITNNGTASDDSDEFAYVTLFFGTPVPDMSQEVSDASRFGVVVEISLSSFTITRTFQLNPISHVAGFVDSKGNPVGCSPNQLRSIALGTNPTNSADWELYVPNICASPKGPVGGEVNVFDVVSVIDLGTGLEDTSTLGTSVINSLIVAQAPDGGAPPTLMMGDPVGMDFKVEGQPTTVAYLVSKAANAIQRVVYSSGGSVVLGKGAGNFTQIQLADPTNSNAADTTPLGLVTAHNQQIAFVDNLTSHTLSVVDLNLQTEAFAVVSDSLPAKGSPADNIRKGENFFNTGVGKVTQTNAAQPFRWSQQGVSSCASCHPNGRSDGITWEFTAGPRRTLPLDPDFNRTNPADQRVYNWTANNDEIHDFEANTRNVQGGHGAIVDSTDTPINLTVGLVLPPDAGQFFIDGGAVETRNDGLSGSAQQVEHALGANNDWDLISDYIQIIATDAHPTRLPQSLIDFNGGQVPDADAGSFIFANNNCAACHGGEKWTVSTVPYTPSQLQNGSASFATDAGPSAPFGPRTVAWSPANVDGGLKGFSYTGVNSDTVEIASEVISFGASDGGSMTIGPERLTCDIRNVGTFNTSALNELLPAGTQAQGQLGFNPPSVLGLATGAPYFHNGSARTLTDVFNSSNAFHYQAFSTNFFPSTHDIANLVAYLQSIDASSAVIPIPQGGDVCTNNFQLVAGSNPQAPIR